jgi:hypothetical protein
MDINGKKVFVVFYDEKKDMSAAREFGKLEAVFLRPPDYHEPEGMVRLARKVLSSWTDGDSLLMVGDPAVCSLCAMVAAEYSTDGKIGLLRFDRRKFGYKRLELDMSHAQPYSNESDNFNDDRGNM